LYEAASAEVAKHLVTPELVEKYRLVPPHTTSSQYGCCASVKPIK